MRRILIAATLALAALALAAGPAAAAGKSANAPGPNRDLLVACYDGTIVLPPQCEPTSSPTPSGTVDNLGQAVAAGYFGNTSNPTTTGHGVVPSLAPGPATGGCAGVTPGSSIGHAITGNGPGAVGRTDPDPC